MCMSVNGCTEKIVKEDESNIELVWCVAGVMGYASEKELMQYEQSINDYLSDEGEKYHVKFEIVLSKEGKFSKKQKEQIRKSDIISIQNQLSTNQNTVLNTLGECVQDGIFEPIETFMETERGKKIREKMLTDITMKSGEWDGKQYLLPTRLQRMVGSTVMIEKNLFEKVGMSPNEEVPDFTECDELFEMLFSANKKKPFLVFSGERTETAINGTEIILPKFIEEIQNNCGSVYYPMTAGTGVLIENGNDEKVENLLQTEYFGKVMDAWKRYMDKGYVSTDVKEQPLVKMTNSYTPEVEYLKVEERIYVIPKAKKYVQYINLPTVCPLQPMTGIGSQSNNKEDAFKMISRAVLDEKIQKIFAEKSSFSGYSLVFQSGMSVEAENRYKKMSKEIPTFILEFSTQTLTGSKIEKVNEVFIEYCNRDVKETYFLNDEKIWQQELNGKLEKAGIEEIIREINDSRK